MLKHTPSMHERLKSSRDTAFTAHDSTADIPPSSPFQADVGLNHNISTSEQAAFTPTKFYTAKQNRKSPNKAFDIHCDDLNMEQDLPQNTVPTPFKIPELPSRRASEDTLKGFDLDMEDVQPSTGQKMDYIDDFNDDLSICDAPTVLSEDTCFSTFSAVPNADMTMFANLGNRTSNHILADMVRMGDDSGERAMLIQDNRLLEGHHHVRQQPIGSKAQHRLPHHQVHDVKYRNLQMVILPASFLISLSSKVAMRQDHDDHLRPSQAQTLVSSPTSTTSDHRGSQDQSHQPSGNQC